MKKCLGTLLLILCAALQAIAQNQEDFYIIQVAAVAEEKAAQEQVTELKNAGKQAAYLWIPDYPSLSGTALFAVYLGPYKTQGDCEAAITACRKEVPSAYGLLASRRNRRVQVNGIGDVRMSDNPPKFHITRLPLDAHENPAANVDVLVGDKSYFLKKIPGIIAPITKKEYAAMGIPETATAACGGWWAGGGDYFYLVAGKAKVVVYEGWQDEGQEDEGYHWKKLREITR